ncbi:Heavy metal transport/detoxification superfamily protein [Perilla frutescens var. hirtella]|nr:Heavy metal transport/detoxification superfamily protein [Perilla frutescens var. frutescens]KAH6783451.1 Heavy metal transport/detoxification superfamily protein [Perilla frutescens var. hirtella]
MGDNKHPNNVIILSIYIHCEGCTNEVLKCLCGYEGVEGVEIDENHKVIVKGENANPFKVAKRLRKKIGKHVELLHTNHIVEIVKQFHTNPLLSSPSAMEPPKGIAVI